MKLLSSWMVWTGSVHTARGMMQGWRAGTALEGGRLKCPAVILLGKPFSWRLVQGEKKKISELPTTNTTLTTHKPLQRHLTGLVVPLVVAYCKESSHTALEQRVR